MQFKYGPSSDILLHPKKTKFQVTYKAIDALCRGESYNRVRFQLRYITISAVSLPQTNSTFLQENSTGCCTLNCSAFTKTGGQTFS